MTRLLILKRDGSETPMDVDEAGALRLHYQQVRPLDEWGANEWGETTLSLLDLVRIEVVDAPETAAHSGLGTEGAERLRQAERDRIAAERASLAKVVLGKPAKAKR